MWHQNNCHPAVLPSYFRTILRKNEQLLQRAVWPRVLTFTAPENVVVEGEDEPLLLELVVTEPEIVRKLSIQLI